MHAFETWKLLKYCNVTLCNTIILQVCIINLKYIKTFKEGKLDNVHILSSTPACMHGH